MRTSRFHGARLFALLALTCMLFPAAGRTADKDFQAIVNRFSAQYQKKPMRFMGLLSFIANRFTPSDMSITKMAIFEDFDPARQPSGCALESFMESVTAGGEYRPFVRVRSNRDGEQTYIYARQADKRYELLIVTLEMDEAVVLKMRLGPNAMDKWVDEPVLMGKDSSHGSGKASR